MRALDQLLLEALEKDDPKAFGGALAKGANPNLMVNQRYPVLFIVAVLGKIQLVDQLLNAGANPDAVDNYGNTALSGTASLGATENHHRVVDRLIAGGADVNFTNDKGFSVLDGAATFLNRRMVHHLVAKGAKFKQNQEILPRLLGNPESRGR